MCYYKYTTAQPTPNTLDWQQEYQSLSRFPALRGQKTFANLPSSRKASQQRDAQARQLLLGEVERVHAQWRNAQAQGDSQASAKAQADLASLQRELARLP